MKKARKPPKNSERGATKNVAAIGFWSKISFASAAFVADQAPPFYPAYRAFTKPGKIHRDAVSFHYRNFQSKRRPQSDFYPTQTNTLNAWSRDDDHPLLFSSQPFNNPTENRLTDERCRMTLAEKKQPQWILEYSSGKQQIDEFKRKTQSFINEPSVEFVEALLIFVSSILVAINTLPDLPWEVVEPLEQIQQILSYLFFAEFVTRWLSCREKQGRYITKPLVLVDVVVIVLPVLLTTFPTLNTPFPGVWDILSGQSGLINLRLLRVLRLQRVLRDEVTFSRFIYSINLSPERSLETKIVGKFELQLARVVLSITTLLSVAAGLIYTAEQRINPDITDYFTAFYFTLTTLTTVGFGDITPITWQGKLIVSGSILAGISIIPSQAAALVEALLERDEEKKKNQPESIERPQKKLQDISTPTIEAFEAVSSSIQIGNTAITGDSGTLETTRKCPVCKVGLHWSHAIYCYNCSSPLET